ncbi:MAG: PDZ domain-containing protein [Planctomycetes bacterium]|nr:PDZ domain-containing protein [Planctomycetota bacterium]
MRRIHFLHLICVLGLAAGATKADDPPATPRAVVVPKPSPDEIEQSIHDLNAPEFSRRETATRNLIAAGADAAEFLVKAVPTSSLEATCRITTILRAWYTSGKDELIEPAEVAFEQLVESKNRHMANRAAAVLDQYATTIRQDRAIAQIKQLGGTIEVSTAMGRLRVAGPDETRSYLVILGRSWRGGEEGLKFLRRVSSLTQLYLLQDQATGKIVTPGVTQDSIDELQRALPTLAVDYRGSAFLGVKTLPNVPICRIDDVPADTPADRAKLMAGDIVIGFDNKPVNSFQDLVKFIGTKQPGDVIKLELLRGADNDEMIFLGQLKGQPESDASKDYLDKLRERIGMKIDVTLGEWGAKPKP